MKNKFEIKIEKKERKLIKKVVLYFDVEHEHFGAWKTCFGLE